MKARMQWCSATYNLAGKPTIGFDVSRACEYIKDNAVDEEWFIGLYYK